VEPKTTEQSDAAANRLRFWARTAAMIEVVVSAGWSAARWITVGVSTTSVLLSLAIRALERSMAPAG